MLSRVTPLETYLEEIDKAADEDFEQQKRTEPTHEFASFQDKIDLAQLLQGAMKFVKLPEYKSDGADFIRDLSKIFINAQINDIYLDGCFWIKPIACAISTYKLINDPSEGLLKSMAIIYYAYDEALDLDAAIKREEAIAIQKRLDIFSIIYDIHLKVDLSSEIDLNTILNNLAVCCFHLGKFQDALAYYDKMYQESLVLGEKVKFLSAMGECYKGCRDLQKARHHYLSAIDLIYKTLFERPPVAEDFYNCLELLSDLYKQLSQLTVKSSLNHEFFVFAASVFDLNSFKLPNMLDFFLLYEEMMLDLSRHRTLVEPLLQWMYIMIFFKDIIHRSNRFQATIQFVSFDDQEYMHRFMNNFDKILSVGDVALFRERQSALETQLSLSIPSISTLHVSMEELKAEVVKLEQENTALKQALTEHKSVSSERKRKAELPAEEPAAKRHETGLFLQGRRRSM